MPRQWSAVTNVGNAPLTIAPLPLLMANLQCTSARLTTHSGLDRRHRLRKQEGADWFAWQTLPGPDQPRIVDGLGLVRASEVVHLQAV